MRKKTEQPNTPPQYMRVGSSWTISDRIGAIAVRLNIRRMNYVVPPGLYACGRPTADSPVFVSANYKLSFDHLRRALAGIDAWILALDTHGINVWCAAGKGTFGTDELIKRIRECRLHDHIQHRQIILPQLGAPGIAAHNIKQHTGFKAVYGPVYAADINAFLHAGMKATPDMRRIRFRWHERLTVAWMELAIHAKKMLVIGILLAATLSLTTQNTSQTAWMVGGKILILWIISYMFAGVLGPLLLPYLPTRSFAIKGACMGIGLAVAGIWATGTAWPQARQLAWLAVVMAGTSHMLLNFTGSTTFTSPSGVRREVRIALPWQIGIGISGMILWIAAGFI